MTLGHRRWLILHIANSLPERPILAYWLTKPLLRPDNNWYTIYVRMER